MRNAYFVDSHVQFRNFLLYIIKNNLLLDHKKEFTRTYFIYDILY